MRRNLLIAAGMLLLMACSKEKPQPPASHPVSEMIGTWSTYSYKAEWDTGSLIATVNDHPCLANNQFEFKQDSTFTFRYTAADTCWLTPPPTTPVIIRTGTILGQVNDPSSNSKWSQNGTTVYLGASHLRATISKSGGKIYLTEIDTINSAVSHQIITIVQVKN